MAEQAKEVSIKLTARDETAHAFNSFQHRLAEFLESGGGEELVKSAVGGAVVVGAFEAVAKSAEITSGFLRKYTEEMELAGNEAERDRAIFLAINDTFKENVPVLGHVAGAIEEVISAWRDYRAARLVEEGASEAEINRQRSREGMRRYALETYAAQREAYNANADAITALILAQDRLNGATAEQIEVDAKANAGMAEVAAARERLERYEREHWNRTPAQNRVVGDMQAEVANRTQASEAEVQEIRDRYRKLRTEQDRDENRQHKDETFRSGQEAADLEAQAQAQRLRREHQNGDADLLLLMRQHQREIEENERAEDQAIAAAQEAAAKRSKERGTNEFAAAGDESRRIQEDAEAKRKAINERFSADAAKLKQDSANSAQDEADQRRHTVASLRLDILKEEAAMGNQAARAASEVLGVQEKYNVKRAELNRLLREAQNLPEEERKKLLALLPVYDAMQKAEVAKMKMGQIGPPTSPFSQQNEMGAGDTGMRETFAAGVRSFEDRQLEMQQKIVDAIIAQGQDAAKIQQSLDDLIKSITVK
jgi:hypothetical protein